MKLLLLLIGIGGCQIGTSALPLTSGVVESSTFKMYEDGTIFEYQGTAWAVTSRDLLSAGHMCSGGGFLSVETNNGRTIPVTMIAWEKSNGPEADLCLMRVHGPAFAPLVLAERMPEVGTATGYVGYPLGTYTVSSGIYAGDGISTAPCNHGASGSALFTDAGVWGVLTQSAPGDLTGASGCATTQLPEILNFMEWAGVHPAGRAYAE